LLEWVVIFLFAVLTVNVLWGVFSRYVIGHQSQWTEEVAIYLLLWVSLLGAALTYRDRGHLGVDYFVGQLPEGLQRLMTFVAEIAVLLFAVFALVYGGMMLVLRNLEANQVTPALGLKVGYLYSAAPICGVFIALFALEHLLGLWRAPPAAGAGEGGGR